MNKQCDFACGKPATKFGLRISDRRVDLCKHCFDATVGRNKRPSKSRPAKQRDLPGQLYFDFKY